jgi:hypothetical protein
MADLSGLELEHRIAIVLLVAGHEHRVRAARLAPDAAVALRRTRWRMLNRAMPWLMGSVRCVCGKLAWNSVVTGHLRISHGG